MSSENARRVFVVDDDPLVLAVTRRLLVRAGYEVTIFDDPRRALEGLAQDPPYAVVADLNMPELSGVELLAEVKQRAPSSLRVLYTGEGSVEGLGGGVAHVVLAKTGGMQALPDTLARLRPEA
ncbi:MAG: response regulator [Polyangiales bacterium]